MDAKAKNFLNLLLRSPDQGDAWRSVSKTLWPLVEAFPHKELIETKNGGVRLSEKGNAVIDYI